MINQQIKELTDNSMLGYICRWFSLKGEPLALKSDLDTYRRSVSMLHRGELSADMFVLISQGVISRIKRDVTCQRLMSQYLQYLNQ